MRSVVLVLVVVGCGPGQPGDASATQTAETATGDASATQTAETATGDGSTTQTAETATEASTSPATDGVTTGGGVTQASEAETGDGTASTTASETGEVCEDIEAVPAGEPDAPCEGGGLLFLWDDEDVLAGLEWCPIDALHRYAAVVCPCGGECRTDDECGVGSACLCASVYDNNGYVSENRCVPADCRTDSDCPAGFECGVSPSMCGWGWNLELHCRTPADTCAGNEDCDGQLCRFDPDTMAWGCTDSWACE
ncbi:hypothetical protein SAMN02745121_08671 [Nannocystis exedens]|uniref:Uncharacterized protein n=1 Tax=Nannocystis exedens TaxID=54 RepID=A0A1I2IFB1_9BACT|nr:hypothetical protein [Nannocystis exedens]PCC73671.1 hypothetical protein NAEX_06759 [Nannocystis exedens]SFF40914.1 hypothetical protein SAMN02745121_08671 [Nannocystis exedens]